jgi:hypothetical protein
MSSQLVLQGTIATAGGPHPALIACQFAAPCYLSPVAPCCMLILLLFLLLLFSAVMNCLQDFRDEIKSDACKSQVHKYVELAAQDIRFDVPLADACYKDRTTLCANVPPVSASHMTFCCVESVVFVFSMCCLRSDRMLVFKQGGTYSYCTL